MCRQTSFILGRKMPKEDRPWISSAVHVTSNSFRKSSFGSSKSSHLKISYFIKSLKNKIRNRIKTTNTTNLLIYVSHLKTTTVSLLATAVAISPAHHMRRSTCLVPITTSVRVSAFLVFHLFWCSMFRFLS